MAKVKSDETDRARETAGNEPVANVEAGEGGAGEYARKPYTKPVIEVSHEGIAVYVGPTIQGKIQKGAVFKGGRTEAESLYADAIAHYPAIARLIVPAERLAKAREEIRLQKGLVYKYYKELVSKVQGR
jgi:hypothetical protein